MKKDLFELLKVSTKLTYHILFIIGLIAFVVFMVVKFI